MKKRNLLQTTILIIALCAINQFANAQPAAHPGCQACGGNKVKINNNFISCDNNKFCNSKCVNANQVQNYLNQGWVLGSCFYCSCVSRLSGTASTDKVFSLNIYPNPVTNSTTISFSVEQTESVSLQIFDLNGRLIKTLADGEMKESEHEIEWNVADVNAGVYFLQFQSAEVSAMEKLIVSK